jgi:hypothetical protein
MGGSKTSLSKMFSQQINHEKEKTPIKIVKNRVKEIAGKVKTPIKIFF